MFHFNFKLFPSCFIITLFLFVGLFFYSPLTVHAISIDDYSYDAIYKLLPAKYQSEDYIYKSSDNIALITFATYKESDYKTSIKKKKGTNELLYCVDYNDAVTFKENYQMNNAFYDNPLRTRLGIAFYYGTCTWGKKAHSEFTTGNFVLDYYMTQLVAHALIYEFGGEHSDFGINYEKIKFKSNTGTLEKKTDKLYDYCRNAVIQFEHGIFQTAEFAFSAPAYRNLFLDNDTLISSKVHCDVNSFNADAIDFSRDFVDTNLPPIGTIHSDSSSYDSPFYVSFDKRDIDQLSPDRYIINIEEYVSFQMKQAVFWCCDEFTYENTSQELSGLNNKTEAVDDNIILELLVGKLYLFKTDSVTEEVIEDAKFQVLQYNSQTKEYEFYCDMTYNASQKQYESDNLYLSVNNMDGKFKVIETSPGKNYTLDWEGQYFEITRDKYIHEIHVENQPVLGKLSIEKMGEKWWFKDSTFMKTYSMHLPNVHFELYAGEDIYVKNQVKFPKNRKIMDLFTDKNGKIVVENLPMGQYYIKETETLNDYILDEKKMDFTITRDANRKYSEVALSFTNQLKTCEIDVFKCYYEDSDSEQKNPIPLKGAKFGLYLKKDLCDIHGNVIVKKDTCIAEQYSDDKGNVSFGQLPYVEYYLKELEAPDDFILNDGIISLKLEDFVYDETTGLYLCKQSIINQKQRFTLCIDKSGDAFSGYGEKTSQYGNYFVYQIGKKNLAGVSFTLYNDKKEMIRTEITDEKGKVYFKDLIPGTYYVSETGAPAEYKVVHLECDVTFHMSSKEYNEFSPPVVDKTFYNEYCECSIHLTKYGERVYVKDGKLQYKQVPLQNVIYGIYQNFDYTCSDGSILQKDSCVGYIVTNKEGNGDFTNKLPCGNYYLKELKTNPGYDLDTEIHYFDIKSNQNKLIEVRLNNDNTFYNQLSKATVQIIKTDAESGKPLKNVEFTLYNEKNQKFGVYKTNKKGKILVENLPYGKYYFVETKSRNGYYSTNNKYHFELESEELVTLNITNSPILKLGYEENYTSALIITGVVTLLFLLITVISYYVRMRTQNHDKEKN